MTIRSLWVPGALALLAVLAFVAATRPSAMPRTSTAAPTPVAATNYQSGDTAPDFSLRTLDGGSVHLSDYRGQVVLLNFWAKWCAPCRVEMPWLVEFDRQYRAQGLQIVGVNLDDTGTSYDSIAAFARERGVTYPILLGNSTVADAYGGVRFMPETFFIAPDGKILSSSYGITTREEFQKNIDDALGKANH